jgi:hypothetical protein
MFEQALGRERFPREFIYLNAYESKAREADSGYETYWDTMHVAAVNDNGNWGDPIDARDCMQPLCSMPRQQIGWGSTRKHYGFYKREYETPPFCYEKLRNMDHARVQIAAIVEGLKKVPDSVNNAFIEYNAMRQEGGDGMIYCCGTAKKELEVVTTQAADHAFFAANGDLNLGGAGNLPTSQLKMEYLNSYVPRLGANGYHDGKYNLGGKFQITMDQQTAQNLCQQNPALAGFYAVPDFVKGGAYYEYGLSGGCGDWLFKWNFEQPRFNHIGNGILRRVYPWENEAATVGIRRKYSPYYETAKYAMYHVFCRGARILFTSNPDPINSEMKFGIPKGYMGQWQWVTPDVIVWTDPVTGTVCPIKNDTHNQGYWVGKYEMGIKNEFPLTEMWILALRENACFGDNVPLCTTPGDWSPNVAYQNLKAYNEYFCDDEDRGYDWVHNT